MLVFKRAGAQSTFVLVLRVAAAALELAATAAGIPVGRGAICGVMGATFSPQPCRRGGRLTG